MSTCLAAGLGAAGTKRFPRIGSVFNTLKQKQQLIADPDNAAGVTILDRLSALVSSKGTPIVVANDRNNTRRKALTMRSALRQIQEKGKRPLQVKRVCEMVSKVQNKKTPSLMLALQRTDAEGKMSLVMDVGAEKEPGSTYAWAVVLGRQLVKVTAETTAMKAALKSQFLPPLTQVGRMKLPPVSARWADVDAELAELSEYWTPDASSESTQEHIIKLLLKIAREINTKLKISIEAFGSRVYGLSTSASDFDLMMTVRVPHGKEEQQFLRFIRMLSTRMQRISGFHRVIWLSHARVPIIKFVYRTRHGECEGDISFNHGSGLAKSKMMKAYMNLDPRVRQVLMVLKKWGVEREIINQNVLNSYGLMMMGLTYLIQERVVPPLQLISTEVIDERGWSNLDALHKSPEAISALYCRPAPDSGPQVEPDPIKCIQTGRDLKEWTVEGNRAYFQNSMNGYKRWKSPNKISALELVFGMFKFYGTQFDPLTQAVSSRLGSASIPRTSLHELQAPMPQMYLERPQMWRDKLRLLAIEDPFDVNINIARNAPAEWVEGLIWEMRRAAGALAAGLAERSDHRVLSRLFVPPSEEIYSDASVWASVYSHLLPVVQETIEENIFDSDGHLPWKSTIPLEELEAAQLRRQ
ncbi:hypothetical protein GGF43_003868 [Coemansia sp. RSA 2618]|nr:hypothetical protein GGF43_003868 [Coemansia sp. RSA 2618]